MNILVQFKHLLWRSVITNLRDPFSTRMSIIQNIVIIFKYCNRLKICKLICLIIKDYRYFSWSYISSSALYSSRNSKYKWYV